MDNKKLGTILICTSLVLLILLVFIRANILKAYQKEIDGYTLAGDVCPVDPDICPHEQMSRAQIPIYITAALLVGVISLGIYILFFEKSQREIIKTLEKQKHIQVEDEKFDLLLRGLSEDEKKVIKAVKEQDGITQQTLRLRTDLHKSKLSIILDGLEKKNLVSKQPKGKTNQIYLKMVL